MKGWNYDVAWNGRKQRNKMANNLFNKVIVENLKKQLSKSN